MTHHVWVDIENPPQVQYLLPLATTFRRAGHAVTLTARDYGMTFELLAAHGEHYEAFGRHFGRTRHAKVVGNLRRAVHLRRRFRNSPRPDLVVSNSRSAALAARSLGIPSFAVIDYEYVDLSAFRATRSYVVHPAVIPAATFEGRGVRSDRLVSFVGIKEDITFAHVDADATSPADLGPLPARSVKRVLVRPPAEESHYHRAASSEALARLYSHLSHRDDLQVVFSPRYPWQTDHLRAVDWRIAPIVLEHPVPFISLLKAVDVVISGGGTMIREAAYLGVPAVSTFQGVLGQVDAHLEELGRLIIVRDTAELTAIDIARLERRDRMHGNPGATAEIVAAVLEVISRERQGAGGRPGARHKSSLGPV